MKEVINILTGKLEEVVGMAYERNTKVNSVERDDLMKAAAELLKLIDKLCDKHDVDFPDEAVDINVDLDDYFGKAIL